jgi:hypothetical protein
MRWTPAIATVKERVTSRTANTEPIKERSMKRAVMFGLTTVLVLAVGPLAAQAPSAYRAPAEDVEAVRQAAFNYIDAIYRADPALVRTSVHPSLAKRGYYQNREGQWQEAEMSFDQLLETARTWNDDGETLRPDAPREVQVFEVLDRTANAKVTAQWGIDYMQLAKFTDGWKIVNIVWQTHPRP